MNLTAKLATEFTGTFLFLSAIGLSILAGPLAPIAIGGMLAALVYMGGHVSGAHYNPAVSLAVFLRRKLTVVQLLTYWLVQVLAALAAFSFAYAASGRAASIQTGNHHTILAALAVELAFTCALALVVLNVAVTPATQGNSFYGAAIGLTVTAGAFVAGPISGGAFNPAVGIGATFASAAYAGGSWSQVWIYLAGPLLGAALAAAVHWLQMRGLEAATAPPEGHPSPGAPAPVP